MKRKKIVWIEDDYDEIPAMVRLFELDNHEIKRYRTRSDVKNDREYVCDCDVIILDIILPSIEDEPYQGVWVLRDLRQEWGYDGPVVVCTVVKNPEVMTALEKLGVTCILIKPVRPSVLYNQVNMVWQIEGKNKADD